MIIRRLGRARKEPRVVAVLVTLLPQEDVTVPAISALRQQPERIQAMAIQELRRIDRALMKKTRSPAGA